MVPVPVPTFEKVTVPVPVLAPYLDHCAAHVCTLFSSTANLRESYGSQVYQGMQPSREETWAGPSVTAL